MTSQTIVARTRASFATQWLIMVIGLLAVAALLLTMGIHDHRSVKREQEDRLRNQAHMVANNLDRQLESVYHGIAGVRDDIPAWNREKNWAGAFRRLKALSSAMPGVRTFLVLDAHGNVLASDRQELLGRNFSSRQYFLEAQRHADGKTVYVSPPFKGVLNVFIITLVVMVPGPNGEFDGIVCASLNPEFFSTMLSAVRYAPDVWTALAHGDGLQFLMDPPREGMGGKNLAVPGSFFSRHVDSGRQENVLSGTVYATGESRMMALRTIKPASVPMDKPLVLAVGRDADAMYEAWRQDQVSRAILFALLALVSVVSLFIYQRRQGQYLRHAEKAQTALHESELWMRSTFHSMDLAVFVSTPDRHLLNCNDAAIDMFGYTLDELRGHTTEILHLDAAHFREFSERAQMAFQEDRVARFEFALRRKNGEVFPSEHAVSLLKSEQGQPLGVLSIVRDISARKEAEEELALWAQVFEHAEWGVVVSSAEGDTLERMNPAFARMHGYAITELAGSPIQDLFAPQSRENLRANILLAHEKGHHTWEAWHQRKNGEQFPVLVDVTAVKDQSDQVRYQIVNVQDISKQKQSEEAIRILAKFPDENPNPVVRVSSRGIVTYANQACRLTPGLQTCQVGMPAPPILEPGLRLSPGRDTGREFEARVGNRFYQFMSAPVAETGDVYLYGQDITERRQLEQQRQLTSVVFDNSIEGIIIADPHGTVQMVNAAYTTITGFPAQEIIGQGLDIFRSEKEPPEFYQDLWDSLTNKESWSGEYWNRRKNGEAYPEWLHVLLIKDSQGGLANIVVIFHDITDIKTKEERIKHQAYHDALTGLPNRVLFLDRLNQAIARAEREGLKLAVVFLDLDHFKRINDSLGHQAGDLLLQETARRLRSSIRKSDTVSRLGGDEFTMLLPNVGRVDDALEVTHRILAALARPFVIQQNELFITTSIGVAFFPHDARNADELLKNADLAMYRAKERGRNNIQMFTADMNEAAQRRLELESRLRQALEKREFLVHYQPRLAVESGAILGMEALVRWQPPDQRLMMPDTFIPLCEETGLILTLGEQVLRHACRDTQAWRQAGHPELSVSVNLSPRQLEQENLLEMVAAVLRETGLPAANLELEITESAIMRNVEKSIDRLAALAEMGVRLSLDDFGTGYSSLSYLKRFAISALKVDRSFVRHLNQDPNDAAIVMAVIAMGHSLDLQVVAEGVETQEQLEFLHRHGCDEYQGYYFSRPVPPDQFQALLDQTTALPDHSDPE